MAQRVYLVRHGESEANVEGKKGRNLEANLTRVGEQDATRNGEKKKELLRRSANMNLVYASPVRRAIQTAQLALQAAVLEDTKLIKVPEMNAVTRGDWEGRLYEEIKDEWRELEKKFGHWSWKAPGESECGYDVVDRALKFIQEVGHTLDEKALTHSSEDLEVVVFSHWSAISALVHGLIEGSRPTRGPRCKGFGNAFHIVLERNDGEWKVTLDGDSYFAPSWRKRERSTNRFRRVVSRIRALRKIQYFVKNKILRKS